MYLFRDQIELSKEEKKGIKEVCLFVVSIYQEYWFTAKKAESAALNDLNLIKSLSSSKILNQKIRKIALYKLKSHLTYLSEDLIGLAIFDKNLPVTEKRKLVRAMMNTNTPRIISSNNMAQMELSDLDDADKMDSLRLADFASKKSLNLFEKLKIPTEFLKFDPDTWESRPDFLDALDKVSYIPVVNDNAERAVALATRFNNGITKDEDQRQYLFQTVREHQQKYVNCNKKLFLDINAQ